MDGEILAEFGHVNKKLDRIIKCQDEFINWQRGVEGRLSAGSVHFDTMADAINKNADNIDVLRRDNKIFSSIAATVGAAVGALTGLFVK